MFIPTLLSAVAAEMAGFDTNLSQVSLAEGQRDMFNTEQRGEGTYYGQNGDSQGACEDHRVSGNKVLWGHNAITVAINKPQWYNGRACGTCLEVTSPKMGLNKAFAIVNNLCPECHTGDLDFATNGDGRWSDLRWKAVPCKGSFFSKFAFIMQGSNQWYLKVAVKRSKFPVTGLQVKAGGRWVSPQSTQGSYFVFTGQQLSFPLTVKVKSVAAPGEEVQDVIPRMVNEQLIEGSAQFSSGGGGGGGNDDDSGDGEEDGDMWPILYSNKKCEKPGDEAIQTVQSRAECEKRAKDMGRRFYNYKTDSGKKCYTSVTCDNPRTTAWDWTVFETPSDAATPSPTPEPTPEPTPAATPAPTPEATPKPTPEAEGMCQPWCHKHEITKWGAGGTDAPGAKCSWKRCCGCAPCASSVSAPVAAPPRTATGAPAVAPKRMPAASAALVARKKTRRAL